MQNRLLRLEELLSHDAQYLGLHSSLAGLDEVGRGPLAGCVLCACVVLEKGFRNEWINDSKKLSEKRREMVYEDILNHAVFVGLGRAEPDKIDEVNILNATKLAMNEAIKACPADILLVDAVKNLDFKGEQFSILHGDALSYSIAAASIVAKVTRDREMVELSQKYPEYHFDKNKGYGTKEHIEALKKFGPCKIHRRSFIKNFL